MPSSYFACLNFEKYYASSKNGRLLVLFPSNFSYPKSVYCYDNILCKSILGTELNELTKCVNRDIGPTLILCKQG